MIDVHPPHGRIQGFRDFFLHLLTITIGLLIALALEACAEWVHHRHVRDEADANLRTEIRDNELELAKARASFATERENLINVLKFLKARSLNEAYDIHHLSLNFSLGTLRNASWRTASAIGALSYMEYPHVQRYATAYQLQDEFSRMQEQTFDEFLRLQSYAVFEFDPNKMPPAEAKTAATDVRLVVSHLQAMDQVGEALSKVY